MEESKFFHQNGVTGKIGRVILYKNKEGVSLFIN